MYYLRCRAPTFPLPYGVPFVPGGPGVPGGSSPYDDDDDDDDGPPPLVPATPPQDEGASDVLDANTSLQIDVGMDSEDGGGTPIIAAAGIAVNASGAVAVDVIGESLGSAGEQHGDDHYDDETASTTGSAGELEMDNVAAGDCGVSQGIGEVRASPDPLFHDGKGEALVAPGADGEYSQGIDMADITYVGEDTGCFFCGA